MIHIMNLLEVFFASVNRESANLLCILYHNYYFHCSIITV